MHLSSYQHMEDLAGRYLVGRPPGMVVDIGSQDVNGTYRPIFDAIGWRYIGCDAAPGTNVDVVAPNPYRYPFASRTVDLVISGQAFEHIDFFWISFLEIARIVKPRGLIFLIAPSRGHEHRYPVDCWRFYPDGYRALARWAGVALLEVGTDWEPSSDPDSAPWGDTVGIFQKDRAGRAGLRRSLVPLLRRGALRLIDRAASLGESRLSTAPPGTPAGCGPRQAQAPVEIAR
jgi:SAM-dependent methyltransferase